mmetsp:Transcript_62218/g.148444  ORF Transcript_62218/g.148444 Transcript_62218/m.148444 type:complete len:357 (+) Transcript_62218:149-1219(+)
MDSAEALRVVRGTAPAVHGWGNAGFDRVSGMANSMLQKDQAMIMEWISSQNLASFCKGEDNVCIGNIAGETFPRALSHDEAPSFSWTTTVGCVAIATVQGSREEAWRQVVHCFTEILPVAVQEATSSTLRAVAFIHCQPMDIEVELKPEIDNAPVQLTIRPGMRYDTLYFHQFVGIVTDNLVHSSGRPSMEIYPSEEEYNEDDDLFSEDDGAEMGKECLHRLCDTATRTTGTERELALRSLASWGIGGALDRLAVAQVLADHPELVDSLVKLGDDTPEDALPEIGELYSLVCAFRLAASCTEGAMTLLAVPAVTTLLDQQQPQSTLPKLIRRMISKATEALRQALQSSKMNAAREG